MARITEKSSISLFAALVTVPFVAATILWFAAIHYAALNAERVNERQDKAIEQSREAIDVNEKRSMSILFDINARTIRIEEKLKKIGERN